MGFTETTFLFIFLPVSILLYIGIEKLFYSDKINNIILVAISMLFYYWAGKESIIVFLTIIVFTYMAGWMIKGFNSHFPHE